MDQAPETSRLQRIKREIAALAWLALGTYLLLCLVSFSNADPSFNNNLSPEQIHNYGGIIGAHLADLLYQFIGLPALLLPIMAFFLAWRLLRARAVKLHLYKIASFVILIISGAGLLAIRLHSIHLGEKKSPRPEVLWAGCCITSSPNILTPPVQPWFCWYVVWSLR